MTNAPSSALPKNLVITGSPGVGKTTLIKECAYPFADVLGGFFTEEIRNGPERLGFRLRTFSGREGTLASKGLTSATRVNKYGVHLNVIDDIGVPAIREAIATKRAVVVDEIGSMELLSAHFREAVAEALGGKTPLLATIRLRAEPFTRQIKKMSDTVLITLSRANYPDVKERVRAWLSARCLL